MDYSNDKVIQNLLAEYKVQREALKNMIKDIEKLKEKIDNLFPQKLDSRYQRFFEEKVKTATGMFNVLLDIRKELSRNLRDEIEIRNKLDKTASDEDLERMYDIRGLAKKVDELNKNKNIVIKKTEEKISEIKA